MATRSRSPVPLTGSQRRPHTGSRRRPHTVLSPQRHGPPSHSPQRLIHDPERSNIASDDKDDPCPTIADGDRAAVCVSQCEAPAKPCVDGAWPAPYIDPLFTGKGHTPELIRKYFAASGAEQQPAAPSSSQRRRSAASVAEQQPVAPSSCQRHQAAASGDGQQPAAQNGAGQQPAEQKVEHNGKGRIDESDDDIGDLWNLAFWENCIEILPDGTRLHEDSQPYSEDSQP